jgi:prephenate dehydratase
VTKRLAYLGPPGTFSQEAAFLYDKDAKQEPFPSIPAVATAVSSGMADEGIVPIENSLEGSVTFTLDLLIQETTLRIRHEMVLPIEHNLMVVEGTERSLIKAIYSHPQALAQCRGFLEKCFPKAEHVASLSTAAAVEDMKASKVPAAAIAPRLSARLYGVKIIAQGIQDNSNNVTRFVVLAHTDHPRTGRDKTSLCFMFSEDVPGLLYRVMGEFARRNINLAKIESRPAKSELGRYYFLIDCEGHREDPLVKEAIEGLAKMTSLLKVFGSYPRWSGNG